jgi:hypothetical protein
MLKPTHKYNNNKEQMLLYQINIVIWDHCKNISYGTSKMYLYSDVDGDVMGQWIIGEKVQTKFTGLRPKLIFKKLICWTL